jgi:hypothetical protein
MRVTSLLQPVAATTPPTRTKPASGKSQPAKMAPMQKKRGLLSYKFSSFVKLPGEKRVIPARVRGAKKEQGFVA